MKFKLRLLYYVLFQIVLLLTSIFILYPYRDTEKWDTFIFMAGYGTIICVIITIILCIMQKSIFTPLILIFLSFWIFQFGLPIVYVFVENYRNFYINLFDYKTIINGSIYSLFSIQIFAISVSLVLMKANKKSKSIFEKVKWLNETKLVSKAALVLFIFTGIIALPLIFYSAYATVTQGFFVAGTRSYLSSNAIFRLVQTFFFPAGLLFLCFNDVKTNICGKVVAITLLMYCIFQMVAGDRTNGLTGVLVLIYYYFFATKDNEFTKSKKIKGMFRQMMFGVILIAVVILLVYIAKARVSDVKLSIKEVVTDGIFKSFFAELGFNFTTICFVMKYVPSITNFQYGLTYLSSIVCLIPKSIDPTGIITSLSERLGEVWLFNINQTQYGGLLDFGVGFSVIGESYYNFGWYGCLVFFIIGWIVAVLLGKNINKCNKFEKYIQLVLLLGFLTFPRRQVYDMLKDIEYNVFFIYIYISFIYYVILKNSPKSKLKRGNNNE